MHLHIRGPVLTHPNRRPNEQTRDALTHVNMCPFDLFGALPPLPFGPPIRPRYSQRCPGIPLNQVMVETGFATTAREEVHIVSSYAFFKVRGLAACPPSLGIAPCRLPSTPRSLGIQGITRRISGAMHGLAHLLRGPGIQRIPTSPARSHRPYWGRGRRGTRPPFDDSIIGYGWALVNCPQVNGRFLAVNGKSAGKQGCFAFRVEWARETQTRRLPARV